MIRYLIFLSLILISCQKELNLGEDFVRVIGEWENIEGDDRIHVKIQKSGKVQIIKSTERIKKVKVNQTHKSSYGENIDGVIWDSYSFYETKKGTIISGFNFSVNSTNDTMRFYNGGTKVTNFVSGQSGIFFKRIK